jgi:hypothetical protein
MKTKLARHRQMLMVLVAHAAFQQIASCQFDPTDLVLQCRFSIAHRFWSSTGGDKREASERGH